MFDVSFIIVSWNAKELLLGCIASIVASSAGISYEIIVIDNNSDDGSGQAVRELYPRVELVLLEDNLGFAKANNLGIARARGNYLCLVNSDVILLDDCTAKMLSFMSHHPDVGISGPLVLNADNSLQPTAGLKPTLASEFFRALFIDQLPVLRRLVFLKRRISLMNYDPVSVEFLAGCFWLVSRKALLSVGGLDESYFMYAEDIDWCARFCRGGWTPIYYRPARIIHLGGGSSRNAPIQYYLQMQRSMEKYWTKHYGLSAAHAARGIVALHSCIRWLGCIVCSFFPTRKRHHFQLLKHRHWAALKWAITRSF